ncbi:MAG: hypothetical protein EZS28_043345, partial [Streblomastix strix]
MTQASGQNAQILFAHIHDGAGLNTTPNQPPTDNWNANGNDINVFVSNSEITVTDADVGHALKTPPMQDIQFFIMMFMELLTGLNAFAIEFWANPIAQEQVRDYKARTLQAPEVTRHAEITPHQILNIAVNTGNTFNSTCARKEHEMALIDLVGKCAAQLCFAERSIYIQIQEKKGVQRAQQFDPGYNGVISRVTQSMHALRQIQGQGSQGLVNPQAVKYSTTAMGPGLQIPQLVTLTPTQIIQQFYSGQLIPRPQIQQPFQGFGLYPGMQQFFKFFRNQAFSNKPNLLQAIAYKYIDSQASLRVYHNSCRVHRHLEQPTLVQQQQNQAQEPRYVNGLLLDSPGTALTRRNAQDQQPLWNKQNLYRTDWSLF